MTGVSEMPWPEGLPYADRPITRAVNPDAEHSFEAPSGEGRQCAVQGCGRLAEHRIHLVRPVS